MNKAFLAVFVLCMLFGACGESYQPKPKAYPRVDFPEKKYQQFVSEDCPYSFEYPVYCKLQQDSLFFVRVAENPCWMDINFHSLNGTLHLSYKSIDSRESLMKLLEDAHKMTFSHTKKADFIDETPLRNDYGVEGMMYDVGGDAASAVQFYLTDDNEHFVRGALYFRSAPNIDSMGIVIDFVKADLVHFVKSFKWVNA